MHSDDVPKDAISIVKWRIRLANDPFVDASAQTLEPFSKVGSRKRLVEVFVLDFAVHPHPRCPYADPSYS